MPDRPADDALAHALGTAPDPRDAAAVEEIGAIVAALRVVPVPDAQLPGWQSLCATEYAAAVRRLLREIALAGGALATAARAVP